MKNVYSDVRAFLIVFFLFLSGLFLEKSQPTLIHFFILVIVTGVLLLSLYTLFFPFWSYDENGFEKWSIFKGKRRYRWSDIKKIIGFQLMDHFSLVTSDGEYLVIGYYFTRDYSKVARDVIGCLMKSNKKIKVPSSFLKYLKIQN